MRILLCLFVLLTTGCAKADVKNIFDEYMWEKRIVVMFAPKTDNGERLEQIAILDDLKSGLSERDIIVWDIVHLEHVKIDGIGQPQLWTPPLYDAFKAPENTFTFILIGKDGEEKLRKNTSVSEAELFGLIDAMPMRQREMQQ